MRYIYCIENKINNKKYIMYNKQDYKRMWSVCKYKLNANKYPNYRLQDDWNKYGEDNFTFFILEEVYDNHDILDSKVQDYIKKWNLLDTRYGYNIASGGWSGNSFAGYTKEEKIQYSKKCSQNNTGEKNPMYGKHLSEATKDKMRANNTAIKKVRCIETGVIYDNAAQANLALGLDKRRSDIRLAIKKGHKARGYSWEYVIED